MKRFALTMVAALALAACDDKAADDLKGVAPGNGTGDAAVGDEVGDASHGAYFAVVSTNYTGATAISLLDAAGDLHEDEWLTSATANAELRTPLAEDVVAPTVSGSRRFLAIMERGLGVITRFDLDEGSVVGQVRADNSDEGDEGAYHSNPQDIAFASDDSAWISRWLTNPDPAAPEAEGGNDLVEFNPMTMERLAGRIDLSSLDTTVDEPEYDADFNVVGTLTSVASARPTALVPVGAYLAVGLGRITDNYSYADGMMAVVDPVAGAITDSVDLAPLRNCGSIGPVPGEAMRVLVSCIGDWALLGPESGLVIVEVDDAGKASIVTRYDVADHADAVAATQNVVSIGGSLAIGVGAGSLDPDTGAVVQADAAYVIDLEAGTQQKVFESAGAYSLGAPAYADGIVLFPDTGSFDAPALGVQRLRVADGVVSVDDFVTVAEGSGLAARQVHAL